MKAFVTGGTGHLGSNLVDFLQDRGHEVVCLVRETSNLEFLKSLKGKISFVVGDLTSQESLLTCIQDSQPDYVFHSAAAVIHWGPWKYFYSHNVLGTQYVVDAVEKTPSVKKLVHVSSLAVNGWESGRDIKEDEPYGKSHNNYSKTKLLTEELLLKKSEEGVPITMIRPPMVFGPNDRMNLRQVLGLIKHGKMMLISKGRFEGSWAYTTDIADLLLEMATNDKATGEVFNVKTGDMTHKEALDKAVELLDQNGLLDASTYKVRSVPVWLARVAGTFGTAFGKLLHRKEEPLVNYHNISVLGRHHTCNIDKAKDLLGWTPKFTMDDALKKTLDWFIESGTYEVL